MSERIHCIECDASEAYTRRKTELTSADLPHGWVLREMVDQLTTRRGAGCSVELLRVTTWVLCPKCALDLTPVIHPEIRRALIGMGFDP